MRSLYARHHDWRVGYPQNPYYHYLSHHVLSIYDFQSTLSADRNVSQFDSDLIAIDQQLLILENDVRTYTDTDTDVDRTLCRGF